MPDMLGKRKYESASCEVRYTQALPISMRQVVREVFNLRATEQGKGHGTKLMESICEEADKSGKILMLIPQDETLVKWYNILGFELAQSEPVKLMLRTPVEMMARGTHGKRKERTG